MRKLLYLFVLIIVLILSMCFTVSASDTKIELSNSEAYAGEKISVSLSISNNTGISGFLLSAQYPEELELVSIKQNSNFNNLEYKLFEKSNLCKLLWVNSLGNVDNTFNGEIAELVFFVDENTVENNYTIELSCVEGIDASRNNLTINTNSAEIMVKSALPKKINIVDDYVIFTQDATLSELEKLLPQDAKILKSDSENGKLVSNGKILIDTGAKYQSFVMGDVDLDGEISAADARIALRNAVELEYLTSYQIKIADVNFSKHVDSSDARAILRGSILLDNPSAWYEKTNDNSVVNPNNPLEDDISDKYKEAKNYIIDMLKSYNNKINLSEFNIPSEDISNIVNYILYNNPDLFFIKPEYSVTNSNGIVIDINFDYLASAETMSAEYQSAIEELFSLADANWSDFEIALFYHDYICQYFEYSTLGTTAYDLLINGKGLCQSYSMLYMDILKHFNIPVKYVVSDSINHGWNMIKIDNMWYHVDLTFDDPQKNIIGRSNHQYFLISDEKLLSYNQHNDDWYVFGDEKIKCESTKYDNMSWKDSTSPFVYLMGNWYGIEKDINGTYNIYKYDFVRHVKEFIKSLNYYWSAQNNSYYVGFFSGFSSLGNMLIYNSGTEIYGYIPASNVTKELYLSEDEMQIFGCIAADNKIKYCLSDNPIDGDDRFAEISVSINGDINSDNKISLADYYLLYCYLNGNNLGVTKEKADYNKDNKNNIQDLYLLRDYIFYNN